MSLPNITCPIRWDENVSDCYFSLESYFRAWNNIVKGKFHLDMWHDFIRAYHKLKKANPEIRSILYKEGYSYIKKYKNGKTVQKYAYYNIVDNYRIISNIKGMSHAGYNTVIRKDIEKLCTDKSFVCKNNDPLFDIEVYLYKKYSVKYYILKIKIEGVENTVDGTNTGIIYAWDPILTTFGTKGSNPYYNNLYLHY